MSLVELRVWLDFVLHVSVEVSIVLLLWPWPFQTSGEQCFNIMACAFQIDDRVTIVRTQCLGSALQSYWKNYCRALD